MKLLSISFAFFFCIAVVALEARPVQSIENPAVVAAAAPVYSTLVFQMKAQGEVIVEVKINSNGDVVTATMVQGHELLRAPCVQAARRWKFQPSEGAAYRVVKLTFSFRPNYKEKKTEAEDTPVFYPPYRVEVTKSRGTIY